ncbi:MAG: hypothetical protein G01um10143_189 [Parcubacteria group bacterium Gr01-1014_3]|nr:MAG: hypothetical protein G01um10143_189 [Parcubacteria group bacterium Gr01-1014_3]
MKLAVFSLAYDPFSGGAEIALKEIVSQSNDHFTIFTHKFDDSWPATSETKNTKVVRLGTGNSAKTTADYYGRFWEKLTYIFRAWRAAEREHQKNKFEAIWAMMASYGGLAALFFKLRHPSIPMLLTLQEGDSERHILSRVGLFYPLWRLIFKKADYIQAISGYLADFARRHGAICPIEVVPNGVDLARIKNQESRIKNNDKIIITTSRLVHKNGVDILISAFARLKNQDYSLQILGDGPDRASLEKLAHDMGVNSRVSFLGQVSADKIPQYLGFAEIFVRASRSEGLGNSFLEAMAAGLPVIGTPVGGIVDFLKHNETGLICNSEDSEDLAKKISELINDQKLRERLAENGRKLILANYSWDLISQKMDKIFRSMIHDSRFMIRVLLATGIYPPEIGGPATYAVLLERELPKRGFGVAVLPFRLVRGWPPGVRHLLYFFKALRRARKADIVFAQDTISVGLPALLAAKLLGRPFVLRVPGDYVWEQSVQRFGVKDGIDEFQSKKHGWRVELMRAIQKFVVRNADAVITPSKYFQKLVGGWIKHPEKVRAIYNGIDLKPLYPNTLSAKRSKIIISAGRLVPWKGFDVLIEIMKELPDWRLEIIGDGPESETLKLKVESLKLQGRVLLSGQIPREELLRRLAQSGIFILNTSFESFSFQLVEAMHVGAPVITTNIGNLSEIVENNKEGILVEPNNKQEILAAIHKIDSDPEFRGMITKNAKEKVKQFSIENTINQVAQLLSTL